MIEGMAQVHMSEAEVIKDIQAVLERVRQGAEVMWSKVIVPWPLSSP